MATATYYSPFYPSPLTNGSKGSTIAAVTSERVDGVVATVGAVSDKANATAASLTTQISRIDQSYQAFQTLQTDVNYQISLTRVDLSAAKTQLQANIDSAKADLVAADTLIRSSVTSLQTDTTNLRTDVNSANSTITGVRTDLTSEVTRAKADTASLRTDLGTTNSTAAGIRTDLTSEVTRAKADTASIRTVTTQLQTDVTGNTTAITNEATTRANADSALSNRSTTLESQFAGTAGSYINSRIATEETTRASADSAVNSRVDSLTTTVNTNTANITTEATTRASADSALANRATTLESKVGNNGVINVNPAFANYTSATGTPDGWTTDNQVGNGASRVAGETGGFALQLNADANANAYAAQTLGPVAANTWWVIEADVKLLSGTFAGAGVLFRVGSQDAVVNFVNDKDSTDTVVGAGVVGQTYRFRKLVQITQFSNAPTFYYMNHWGALGSISASNSIVWYRDAVRPASSAEIAAQRADTNASSALARITTEETTRANADSALAGRATTLESQFAGTSGSAVLTRISTEETTRATADTALGNRATTLESQFAGNTGSYINSRIATEETTRSNADSALANRATTLESQFAGTTGSQIQSRIATEETTRANADSALSSRTSTLESTYSSGGGNIAPNSSLVTSDGYFITVSQVPFTLGINQAGTPWMLGNVENNISIHSGAGFSGYNEVAGPLFAVTAGTYLQFFVYSASHRCTGWATLFYYDGNDTNVGYAGEYPSTRQNNGGNSLDGWDRLGSPSVLVPANAVKARFVFRSYNGTNDPYTWFTRPYVSQSRAGLTKFNDYGPSDDRPVVASTIARIGTEETTRANADSALAGRATTLESQFAGTAGSQIQSRIATEETTRASADSALSNRSTTLESQLAGNTASYVNSRIATEETTRANADSALSNRATTLESQFAGNTGSYINSRIATEETTRANADSALSNRSLVLESTANKGSAFNRNPTFSQYSGTNYPDNWADDVNNAAVFSRVTGDSGVGYAMRVQAPNGQQAYIGQNISLLTPNAWYVVETDLLLNAGDFRASGIYLPNVLAISFYNMVDTTDTQVQLGVVGRRYKFSYLFQNNTTVNSMLYAMTKWGGLGELSASADITWYRHAIRPASYPEIKAQKSFATDIPNAVSRIATEETTRANADSALAGRTTTVESQLAGNASSYINSRIATEETTRANADSALAGRTTTVESQLAGSTGSYINSRIATEETTRSTADTALSNRSTTLESTASGGGSLNANSSYAVWPDNTTLPYRWTYWDGPSGWTLTRVASGRPTSPWAARIYAPGGNNCGIAQWYGDSNTQVPMIPGWYVMEADVTLESGTWNGSGLTIQGQINLNFATEADNAGVISATQGGNRRFSKLVQVTTAGLVNWHPMTNWDGFGSPRDTKTLSWFKASIRQATSIEIAANKAIITDIPATIARIATEESTRSTADTALANRATTLESIANLGTDSPLYARIRTEESTRASADATLANRTSVLESSSSSDPTGITTNSIFNAPNWTSGIPPYYADWANDNSAYIGPYNGTRTGRHYSNPPLQIDRGGTNNGIRQQYSNLGAGYYVIDVDVSIEDGVWNGIGTHINFLNGYAYNLHFGSEADNAGTVYAGGGDGNRQFSFLIYNGAASATTQHYIMPGWSGFGVGAPGFVRTVWHKWRLRPASQAEIAAKKANEGVTSAVARIATEETTRANADTAIANRTTTLEASTNRDTTMLNRNANFSDWPDGQGMPTGMSFSTNGYSYMSKVAGVLGKWAMRYQAPANYGNIFPVWDGGTSNGDSIFEPAFTNVDGNGYYVVEADITLNSGTLAGSGIWATIYGPSNVRTNTIDFYSTPTASGSPAYDGVAGTRYKWAVLCKYDSGSPGKFRVHPMTAWDGFGRGYPAKDITWNKCGVRPASAAEIATGQISTISARVTTNESAVANLNGRTAAYWQTTAVAGNNRAQVTVRADANSGAGVDIVGDVRIDGAVQIGSSTADRIVTSSLNSSNLTLYAPTNNSSTVDDQYAIRGNLVTKIQPNRWYSNIYSREGYTGGAVIQAMFTATSGEKFFGLSENRAYNNSNDYNTLQYAWYHNGDAGNPSMSIFENGNGIQGAVYSFNSTYRITYDGVYVRYYVDNTVVRQVAAGAGRTFYAAITLSDPGSSQKIGTFGPYTDNSLTNADPAARINSNSTTIDGGKITTNTLDAQKIVALSITTDRLVDNSVTKSVVMGTTNQYTGSGYTQIYGGSGTTGGGGGGSGGGGSGGTGDNCVIVTSYLPSGSQAGSAEAGDPLVLLNRDNDDGYYVGEVQAIRYGAEQCFMLTTQSGIKLEVSHSTPITSRNGVVHAVIDSLGVLVPVLDEGNFRWEKITSVVPTGLKPVAMISADDGVYAAGETPGRYIFTHNIYYKP